MDPRLLQYYNLELQHLREMGAEFAEQFPKIAARLGMVKNEIEAVLNLADTLNQRVIGQRHALEMIAKRIQTSRAKLDNPNKPIGVFMRRPSLPGSVPRSFFTVPGLSWLKGHSVSSVSISVTATISPISAIAPSD